MTADQATPMAGIRPTVVEVCIDCADDERLCSFWATALAYEPVRHGAGWRKLQDPAGRGPSVWFQRVPEPKTVKNRLHFDVYFADEAAATAKRDELTALGGRALQRYFDFWLMQDPEGNELCLCWPATRD